MDDEKRLSLVEESFGPTFQFDEGPSWRKKAKEKIFEREFLSSYKIRPAVYRFVLAKNTLPYPGEEPRENYNQDITQEEKHEYCWIIEWFDFIEKGAFRLERLNELRNLWFFLDSDGGVRLRVFGIYGMSGITELNMEHLYYDLLRSIQNEEM